MQDVLTDKLIRRLIQQGVVTQEQYNAARTASKNAAQPLSAVLVEKGFTTETALTQFLAHEFALEIVNPARAEIPQATLALVPFSTAEQFTLIPLAQDERTLTLAVADPTLLPVFDDIKARTKLRVALTLSEPSQIRSAIRQHYVKEDEGLQGMMQELTSAVEAFGAEEEIATSDLLKMAQETPVIKLANSLILDAIRRRASDLFVEPWEERLRVRCRVDGLLQEVSSPPKRVAPALISRLKVMSNLNIAERRIPQDGRIKVKLPDRDVDLRVSVLPSSFGEKVCIRILDKKQQMVVLAQLGFSQEDLGKIQQAVSKPHGMVLITGPTGSGKSTSLYAMLKEIDSPEKNITTVEDPIEYQMPGINQVQVSEAIQLTFSRVLRAILRQDPDVIMVGEIRDLETMDTAIKSALTGHLVLSTLHTNDAASSVTRMLNMGVEPFLITSSVLMISAQRLVRKLCVKCRALQELAPALRKELRLGADGRHEIFGPKGCRDCHGTGYRGRTVLTEVLSLTPAVKALILQGANASHIKGRAHEEGMLTLRESGMQKVLAGDTSLDEVLRVTAPDEVFGAGGAQ